MARTGMGNSQSQPQLSFLNLSNYNSPTPKPMPHSDQRHILIAERLRDVIFSAKYVNHGSDPLPFTAEKIKSEIERRVHQFLPSFHTPTHLPYASRAAKGSNGEEGPSEETTSVFFDTHSNLSDEEENGSIDALCFKKLQEGNRHVELFDSISDHDDNEVSEMIDAQSSKENARCKVSDEQNKLQEELLFKVNDDRSQLDNTDDPQLFKEQPQHIGPFETNMTSETSVAGSLPLEHQIKTPRHAEQGKTCTPESGKHANAKLLDIISSPKVQPSERRGRGRPRKLNIHGTLAVPSSSSPQDCNHQCLEMNSEVNEASKVQTGDDTHYLDQQQHQISMSETVSPPKDPDHQQSLDKRDSGMPLKRKFDADLSLRDVLTSKNEQQEPKRRGRGRPRKVL